MLSRSAKAALIKLSAQRISEAFMKVAEQPQIGARRSPQFELRRRNLLTSQGYDPRTSDSDMRAMAEKERYDSQVKNLYDQLYGAEPQVPTAKEQEAKVLSVPQ